MMVHWIFGRRGDAVPLSMTIVILDSQPSSSLFYIIIFIQFTASIFKESNIVVLAVKPNLFTHVVRDLKECNGPENQLALSVMSGITIEELEKVIQHYWPIETFILCLMHTGPFSKSAQSKSHNSCDAQYSCFGGCWLCRYSFQSTLLNIILSNSFIYSVYCLNEHASSKHADVTIKILESVGICYQVPERHMNAYTGLCGSAPAYVSEQ